MITGLVMAAWNAGRWIDDAIASVARQTSDQWALIVVDDGSTDDTLHKAETWARRQHRPYAGKIHAMQLTEHAGLPRAVNAGVRFLGELADPITRIGCLAADDFVDRNYVAVLGAALDTNLRAPCAYGRVGEFGDRTGFWWPGEWKSGLLAERNMIPGCAVWRRHVWNRLVGFDERFRAGFEDWHFAARAESFGLVNHFCRPAFVPATSYWHRAHDASLSSRLTDDYVVWAQSEIRALFRHHRTPALVSPPASGPIVHGPIPLPAED